MKKEIICVVCPSSCHITVEGEGEDIRKVEGYTGNRGKEYAASEFAKPVRMLSTTVKASGYVSPVIAVRSNRPIPKELQFACMDVIRNTEVKAPFKVGRVVIENILDTGADIILANC